MKKKSALHPRAPRPAPSRGGVSPRGGGAGLVRGTSLLSERGRGGGKRKECTKGKTLLAEL